MKYPWVPITSGAGAFGPGVPKPFFMENYSTATNPVSHKAFQNLPMNTDAPAVIVKEQNPKGKFQSTKVRKDGEGAGENYVDSFVLHPIKGNYQDILARLSAQTEEARRQMAQGPEYPTLLTLVEQGYTNIGRSADEEFQNSVRDKLRAAGASDEEIEVILKEARMKRLRDAAMAAETAEQRQRRLTKELADQYTRLSAGMGRSMGSRAPFDPNVFSFGIPAPAQAGMANAEAEPGNGIYSGRLRARGPGPAARENTAGLPPGITQFGQVQPRGRGRPSGTRAEREAQLPREAIEARLAADRARRAGAGQSAAAAAEVLRRAQATADRAREAQRERDMAGLSLAERLERL